MKTIIILLSLILLAEIVTWSALFMVWGPAPDAKKNETIYDNQAARRFFQNRMRKELSLNAAGDKFEFTVPPDPSVNSVKSAPQAFASLSNYFYSQTGTTHPWATYDFHQAVTGFAFPDRDIGKILGEISQKINREPQEARLVMEQGRATEFAPHENGRIVNLRKSLPQIKLALLTSQSELPLPVTILPPQRHLADLNNLGIKELIGRGQSDFTGSTRSRITNIRVGSARYNGIIIKPGEEFSFNKYLGEVDAKNGFLPELVIKPEGLTPEFGGGLCQVSTTAFRAAFFGGLPITARRNHSYAVRYYEWISDDRPRAVGLDATIYSGVQDMKFMNDTPGAILVWTHIEGSRLVFDFYGTNDGRRVVVEGPHPYDKKPTGAVKSKVTRTVMKEGQEPQAETFHSRYVPPKTLPQTVEYPKPPEAPPAPPPPAT